MKIYSFLLTVALGTFGFYSALNAAVRVQLIGERSLDPYQAAESTFRALLCFSIVYLIWRADEVAERSRSASAVPKR